VNVNYKELIDSWTFKLYMKLNGGSASI